MLQPDDTSAERLYWLYAVTRGMLASPGIVVLRSLLRALYVWVTV